MKLSNLVFIFFSLSLSSGGTVAEELTPQTYIDIEISVRSITLEQLREMVSGKEIGINYLQKIAKKYEEYNTTSSDHLKYGNSNQANVKNWLKQHSDKQTELDQLGLEFEQLIQKTD